MHRKPKKHVASDSDDETAHRRAKPKKKTRSPNVRERCSHYDECYVGPCETHPVRFGSSLSKTEQVAQEGSQLAA
jgi:hypothetical protein